MIVDRLIALCFIIKQTNSYIPHKLLFTWAVHLIALDSTKAEIKFSLFIQGSLFKGCCGLFGIQFVTARTHYIQYSEYIGDDCQRENFKLKCKVEDV